MTFLQQDLEQPVTYLDNSSTTQPCPTAVSRMTAALTEGWGNPSSLHRLGMVAQLEDYDLWMAQYYHVPFFPYNFQIWQYAADGRVDGINHSVDLNLMFLDYQPS